MTLGLLFCQYEIVNYGYRSVLYFWRVISILYGVALLILGAILLGTELGSMDETCAQVWATMSPHQQSYFLNNVQNLSAERSTNVRLCGAFAIIVGLFMMLSGVT